MPNSFAPQPQPNLFHDDIHPRLFLGPDDIPALRERSTRGVGLRVVNVMRKRAADYLSPASSTYVDLKAGVTGLLKGFGGGVFSDGADALHCYAWLYTLTGEAKWAGRVRDILRCVVSQWKGELIAPGFQTNVCYASFGGQLVVAYDMVHDTMDAGEREAVEKYIREVIVEGYRRDVLNKPSEHFWGLGTNIFLRNFEKYVVAMAATWRNTDEDKAALEEAIRMVRASLHMGVDKGGAIYEGPGYGWRDTEWLGFIAETFYRVGAANLWKEEPRYAALHQHWAHLVLPGNRGVHCYCDAHVHMKGRPHVGLLLAARRMGDPVAQWSWEQLGGRDTYFDVGPAPDCFTHQLGLVALWDDDQADATPPPNATYPTARNSGDAGVITMRTGWGDDDLAFNLLASSHTPGSNIHQQVDAGHFSLFALGEAFSVDSGYGDIGGEFHSVIRPYGQNPARAPRGFDQMWHGGRVESFHAGRDADVACVNTSEQWETIWAYRDAMVIRAAGAPAYVLLLDRVNAGHDYEQYQWRLNSHPDNTIAIDAAAEQATIHGQTNRLQLAWAYPGADQYPKPHALRLSTHLLDGAPRAVTPVGPNGTHGQGWPEGYGIGSRPQLVADLLGYNGTLLSAMMPRRADDSPVDVQWIHGRGQFGFHLNFGDVVDTVIVSEHHRIIDLDGVKAEARMVVRRCDQAGQVLWWSAADAYAVHINGEIVLSHQQQPLTLAEPATRD